MSIMNELLSTASFGESDRLDATLRELGALQARFDALIDVLGAKGLLTADDLARLKAEIPAPVTNAELDRLDVKEP